MIKVLLVDDDSLARHGILTMVPWSKYNMIVVADLANGQEALQFLRMNSADLLITDLQMPIMGGLELIEKARELQPGLKTVVLSFYEDFHLVQQSLRLGVIDYISKVRFDQENINETFLRIQTQMEAYLPYESHTQVEGTILRSAQVTEVKTTHYPDFEPILKDWIDLYWIYDDRIWTRLRKKSYALPLHSLLNLLGTVQYRILETFNYSIEIEDSALQTNQEILHAISDLRRGLYEESKLGLSQDSNERRILQVILHIKENISENIRTVDMANSVNLSRSYFCTIFKNITGNNFVQFLRRTRIDHARKLLKTTDLSLDDIGSACGYNDEKYFKAIFTQDVGINMNEYRKLHHEANLE